MHAPPHTLIAEDDAGKALLSSVTEETIARAARRAVDASVDYAGFIRVREPFQQEGIVWDGAVIIFTSRKGTVFAWAFESGPEQKCVAMLRQPSIDSPQAAVQAWFADLQVRCEAAFYRPVVDALYPSIVEP